MLGTYCNYYDPNFAFELMGAHSSIVPGGAGHFERDLSGDYGSSHHDIPDEVGSHQGNARSAAEASMLVHDDYKYRQLPCRTFVSVGTCPYRERCVYLHDPRCICRDAKSKTRRKNKEDENVDSLFWPVLPSDFVRRRLDNNGQPIVIQPYHVPTPKSDQYQLHDEAVFSMWNHFTSYCSGVTSNPSHLKSEPVNEFTRKFRLETFIVLSRGCTPIRTENLLSVSTLDNLLSKTQLQQLPKLSHITRVTSGSPTSFYIASERDDESHCSIDQEFDYELSDSMPQFSDTSFRPLTKNNSPLSITSTLRLSPEVTPNSFNADANNTFKPHRTSPSSFPMSPTSDICSLPQNDNDIFVEMKRCIDRFQELEAIRTIKAKKIEAWRSETRMKGSGSSRMSPVSGIPFPQFEDELNI